MNSKSRKKLPKHIKDLSSEQLMEILRKKKQCNTRALRIVERLIEQHVEESWALDNFGFISQSHYDDVTEERFITKLCGYPFCPQSLENVPEQRYKISLTNKAVYDITDRKKFCSADCYKSSQYLRSQLLTSPLWFRENEATPVFKLLKLEKKDAVTVAERGEPSDCDKGMVEPRVEKVSSVVLPLTTKRKKETVPTDVNLDPVSKVEKIVDEWFTAKTFLFLFGKEELRKKFHDKEEVLKNCLKHSDGEFTDPDRFDSLSKLFSALDFDEDDAEERELKPLPDYTALRDEAKKMNLRIQAFYTGQLEIPVEDVSKESDEEQEGGLTKDIPLVDSKAQADLRRKVLFEQLNKKMPEMSVDLELGAVATADIRCLVRTFFLTATNITMKPSEWSLATVIIFKMLSLKIESLAKSFQSDVGKNRVGILLSKFNLGEEYLENLMTKLVDEEGLTRKLLKQNMY